MTAYINYGIDLGTTNSCIARWENGEVRVFQSPDQRSVTPSAVQILRSGRLVVGTRAYNARIEDPDNVATEFKRWMGQKDRKSFPASGKSMSAEELSAEVLKSLRADVQRLVMDDPRTAVITVPAAFGTLQCDATARAARLAGFEQTPLLQEPIAAAIAYGVTPGAKDQRWLVFDLGGGTLDIAIISTRDGRLSVLDHRGNNLLGGKDFDRKIAEALFLPALSREFVVPSAPEEYQHLLRLLIGKAEEAKIELSTADRVIVELYDVGNDARGIPIEMDFVLTRADLEREIEPIVEKALRLTEETLAGARLTGADLDRVLLVGGPTQMPLIRQALAARLGARLDVSLDPMTVVARGAAIYASTIERSTASLSPVPAMRGTVVVKLAFEPVSSRLHAPVAVRIEQDPSGSVTDLKIDAESGFWTSGWIPLDDGFFEIDVRLQENQVNRFLLTARDRSGRLLEVEPATFTIRHGLVVAAPPLPKSLGVEILRPDGRAELDVVFPKGTPLPVSRTMTYQASRTLRPSERGTSLAIKLWEGEELSDPQANTWVGNMHIRADNLRRPIPEGSDIELTIHIDASRLITVEAFVPHLNQHFSDKVYIPEEEEQSYVDLARTKLQEEIESHLDRLESLESQLVALGDEEAYQEAERIRQDIEELDIEASQLIRHSGAQDPDQAKRLVESSREIRGRLSGLERSLGVDRRQIEQEEGAELLVARLDELIVNHGTTLEQKEYGLLCRQLERSQAKQDDRGVRKTLEQLEALEWRILYRQPWFWQQIFHSFQQPGRRFVNAAEAQRWFLRGEEAIHCGDLEGLREAVDHLWALQPTNDAEADRERARRSGLRRSG